MVQKKICMIGDFAVGKTSLVARFVRQTFSDKYLTTVGVKIDTKIVNVAEQQVKLILWDIAGADSFTTTTASYLRGATGYFLIVDGTRRPTWESALKLKQAVTEQIGEKPFVILLNKADLTDEWEIEDQLITAQEQEGWKILRTSARTGENVEAAFTELATKLIS
ncbi:MAG: Rab family GTPase [Thiotrichaceae bacterium]|nr:Rab family GTPase [Thiotrichaceae bacterium]